MRRLLPFVLAAACAAAGAADLPAHPFVSTAGKAQMWVAPDIAALYFETGAQNGSAEQATASLDLYGTAGDPVRPVGDRGVQACRAFWRCHHHQESSALNQ